MQRQETVYLYPLDNAGVILAKKKLEAEEGRSLSKAAVLRKLIQAGLAEVGITRKEMRSKLATPATTPDQS